MDLSQLANLGEFVGGLAVLATLIYLALQVRQSVLQTKVSSYQTAVVGYAERIERIATDDAYREVFVAGLGNYDDLSAEEKFRFHAIMQVTLAIFQNSLHLFRAGVLPADEFRVYERDVVGILKSPGASVWWANVGHLESQSINRYLEEILRSMGPDTPALTESLPFLSTRSASAKTP